MNILIAYEKVISKCINKNFKEAYVNWNKKNLSDNCI